MRRLHTGRFRRIHFGCDRPEMARLEPRMIFRDLIGTSATVVITARLAK
jgi:hypothetical protein